MFDGTTTFFELGGYSLLGAQMISRLRLRTWRNVLLRALFERSDLAGFASLVLEASEPCARIAR